MKFCLFLALLFFPFFGGQAASFDCYVDHSAAEDGDGSESRPFETISQATDECRGKILIKNGTYSENVSLKKSTELFGENQQKTAISGRVTMGDRTALENLTVRGSSTTVVVEKDADVEIKNCTIKDFAKIGIETLAGGGKFKIFDSKIHSGGGKGFYIQRGKTIEIRNNEIYENDEEGLDIRSSVSGVVEKNILRKNGESGIELVVGSADLKIRNNLLEKNGASGVAVQFYPELDRRGQIHLKDNKLGENRKYGLDCNRPQGGSPGDSYWQDSLELETNDIYSNKLGAINAYCKLVDAVDEDEEKDNSISEEGYQEEENEQADLKKTLTEEEAARVRAEEEAKKKAREEALEKMEKLLEKQELLKQEVAEQVEILQQEKKWKVFFRGADAEALEKALAKLEQEAALQKEVNALLEGARLEAEEELSVRTRLGELERMANQQREIVAEKEKVFSLWGWLKGIFGV